MGRGVGGVAVARTLAFRGRARAICDGRLVGMSYSLREAMRRALRRQRITR